MMFTQQSEPDAQRLLACTAVFADATGDPAIDHHPLTSDHARDIRSRSVNDSGSIRSEDPGRRDCNSRQSANHEYIQMVESRRVKAHADVCWRADIRHRDVLAEPHLIETAMSRNRQRSHRDLRRTSWQCVPDIYFAMLTIKVPPLGESITEATVSRWLKNEGDAVAAGETLVELETDKITVEVPALQAGVLGRHAKNEGDVVGVNDTLGELDETAAGASAPAVSSSASAATQRASGATPAGRADWAPTTAPRVSPTAPQPQAPGAPQVRSGPAARRLADESGLDLSTVAGTGRAGVVSKADVIAAQGPIARPPAAPAPPPAFQGAPPPVLPQRPPAHAAAYTPPGIPPRIPAAAPASSVPPQAAPAPVTPPAPTIAGQSPPSATTPIPPSADAARETREKLSTRRKRIAENLLQAQHATAHLTTFNDIDMSAIVSLRNRLREKVEQQFGVKLSYMPFFAKAASIALKAYPVVNAQIVGDSIVYKQYVHLGIAVASEAGLVVPIVRDADGRGIIALSREIAAVAGRAREGKLTLDDLSGGTFTITNGGVFGSLLSTPIINYPQSAILGLHKMQDRPIVVDGRVEVRPMMYVALSYDHRLIDGQQAVLFLVRVKELMEDPASMLID
jgi:2-oxoglutarate dehydrogenase E2 component (dihydrolipoamide succinyltransferase)